jgi:hypothetical protein
MEDAGTRSGMPTEGNNDGGTSENTGGINGKAQITQHIFDYDSGIGSHIRFPATSNLIIAVESKRERTKKLNCLSIQREEKL